MLRIGFDAKRLFNNFTGLGNYSRTLVKGLREHFPLNEYHLFTPRLRQTAETAFFLTPDFKRITPSGMPGAVWRSFFLRRDIAKGELDCYHGLSNELPLGIAGTRTCAVVTIHDLIFRFYPEDYPWIDRRVYETKFRYACEQSHRIVAVSESTKRDLITHYGIPGEKIAVVYQTCDDRFRREIGEGEIASALSRYALPARYLLYVGTINRRKNHLAHAQAMRQVRGTVKQLLVVVGRGKKYKQEVLKYLHDNGMTDAVRFVSPVDPADLPALYRRASAVILPSRYEGFGLPIVEALFCRVPVITSKVSSLPEAAGPGAFYIDPDKPDSIAEGIIKITSSPDYARQLADEGHRYVQRFNVRDISRDLMAVYEETLRQAGRKEKTSSGIPTLVA